VRVAIAELTPEQEEEAARRLVAARLAATRGRPLATRMRRLMGVLARKGYPPALAYRIVREALEQEKIDPGDPGLDEEAMPDDDPIMDDDPGFGGDLGPDGESGLGDAPGSDGAPGFGGYPRLI
jgi:hypothetical protein